jgi:hypothetical protein
MLQEAGYKPALHLVAQNQMDREHPARPFPQAPPFVAKALDRAALAAPFTVSTGPCFNRRS